MLSSICFAQEGYIFFYDFNADQTGNAPSGGWKPTVEGKIEVADVPSATNKSVRVTDVGNGGGMTLLLDKPITGKTITMECKFMRDKGWSVACEIFYVMNQKCPDDFSGICIKDNDDGTLAYHNGVDWVNSIPLVDGAWHDIKLVMDTVNDKYDFYFDGNEIVKGAGFRKFTGLEGQGMDKFNVANVGDGGSTFVKYFDDIILYEGNTRPVITSVKPAYKLTTKWGDIKVSMLQKPYREYPAGHRATRFEKGLLPKSYTTFVRHTR
ncbi:MAG: hypothetical protein QG588_890 [Candidatus Poribacteria bacterium]|nr:hypothetical protein [Candidatus Poribacteria bacterium]